jgi:metal-sulfur cluster biosynthetic enzyme
VNRPVSEPAVRAVLRDVYDPCSQAWQRPLSVVDLGLVRQITTTDTGQVTVRVSLTVPFCIAVATIMQSVERRVSELPGVTDVTVEIDQDTPWSPQRMTDEGRRWLRHRRSVDGASAASPSTSGAIRPAPTPTLP